MQDIKKFVFDVRNWLSISAAVVFVILALRGSLSSQESMVVVMMVFSFFLGRETGKTSSAKPPENPSLPTDGGV